MGVKNFCRSALCVCNEAGDCAGQKQSIVYDKTPTSGCRANRSSIPVEFALAGLMQIVFHFP